MRSGSAVFALSASGALCRWRLRGGAAGAAPWVHECAAPAGGGGAFALAADGRHCLLAGGAAAAGARLLDCGDAASADAAAAPPRARFVLDWADAPPPRRPAAAVCALAWGGDQQGGAPHFVTGDVAGGVLHWGADEAARAAHLEANAALA